MKNQPKQYYNFSKLASYKINQWKYCSITNKTWWDKKDIIQNITKYIKYLGINLIMTYSVLTWIKPQWTL